MASQQNEGEWDREAFARQVAEKLISYRAELGLTQVQLAGRVGMVQSVVARLESGEQPPSLATLAKLSRGLGVEFVVTVTPTAVTLSV
jgi:transcriptional regulator with XRE-family HTH domain